MQAQLPAPRRVTVATKLTPEEAGRLAEACEREGVTRSTFLRRALLQALRRRRDGEVDVDLVATEAEQLTD